MKLFLKYLEQFKIESVLSPVFKMLEAIFELFVPLVIASLIDKGIASGDGLLISKDIILLLGLAIIGLGCSITAQYFAAKSAIGAASLLRNDLFSYFQSLGFSEIDKVGSTTMLNRLTSDITLFQTGINMTLRLFLRSPFIVFGAMIMAFTIDVKAALIFAVTIPVLAVVVYGIMYKTIPMYKAVQKKLDEILILISENLSGVRVIRAFGIEDSEAEKYNTNNLLLKKSQIKVGNLSGAEGPITFVVVNAATLILLYTGAIKADAGNLSKGEVVALLNYMAQILVELVKLANLLVTMSKGLAGAQRICEVFPEEAWRMGDYVNQGENKKNPESIRQSGITKNFRRDSQNNSLGEENYVNQEMIAFNNVCLSYEGESALSDISFSVKRGETIGIIGGTGSGKTSLINLIAGFYKPTSGYISRFSDDVAVVMQKAVLIKGDVESNLKFAKPDATVDEMIKALKVANAYDFVFEKDGLGTKVEQGGQNFSGGQRQRLNIARGFIKDADVLILDDSFSALDYATDAALRASLTDNKRENTSVFIVSQRASSVMSADKIIVLEDGIMVGFGNHDELLKCCDVYKEIYDIQFAK